MKVEDGSLVVPAALGAQFMQDFFGGSAHTCWALLWAACSTGGSAQKCSGLHRLLHAAHV